MITFEVNTTGGQIARELARDEVEMAYALQAMAEDVSERAMQRVAEVVAEELDADEVIEFLRTLADTIQCATTGGINA
jgi:ribonucleotide reductase beta subunit family protein with ferritin-like domain